MRLISAEYRELQRARPIEVVPAATEWAWGHISGTWCSPGPRTPRGKAVSSQNARRHGLTAEPDPNIVGAWFNVILGNGPGAYEEPSAADQADLGREVALRLAIAEAHYHRALHVLEAHP